MQRRSLLVVPLFLALAGCAAVSLATRDAPELFALTPKSSFDAGLPELRGETLQIEVPTAAAGLNTARIALKPTPTTLQYFAGATWIEVLPVMVQSLAFESFENADRIEVFGNQVTGPRGDWALRLHIREFQAEYDAPNLPPLIRVRLQVRLLRLPRRDEVGTASFESTQPAPSTALRDIVVAMDEALGANLRDTVEWTLRRIAEVDRRR